MYRLLSIQKISVRQLIYVCAFVSLSLALLLPYQTIKASEGEGSTSLWIPMVESGKLGDGGNNGGGNNGGGNGGGGNNPPPPPPPPPTEKAWAFFADTQSKTSSSSIVIDAQGGKHMAYLYYEPLGDNEPTYGVYLYCASDCDDTSKWQGVGLGELVNEIQVAVTKDGKPRLLYRAAATEDNGDDYYYAECNQNCTLPAQWTIAQVATARGMAVVQFSDDELPQRYFALDPQGRPRFVYGDRDTWREPDHLGTFYAYCDSVCTDPSNWFETRINKDNGNEWNPRSEKYYYPSLTFSPSGQARVVAEGTSMQDESLLYYVACEAQCEVAENWQSAALFSRGSGVNVSADVEVDAQGRPRLAFFEGAQLEGKGDRLWYGWCNQSCTDAVNWQRYEVGLASADGQEPDLELDATGKPRIAYALSGQGGLGYGWCDSNCESLNGQWQHKVVESRNQLEAIWPVAFPQHCDNGLWEGLTPTLALDKNGNALFAYDASYYARCWYNVETREWEVFSQFHLVWRTARTYFLPKP